MSKKHNKDVLALRIRRKKPGHKWKVKSHDDAVELNPHAHHAQPTDQGGTNEASNITPVVPKDHTHFHGFFDLYDEDLERVRPASPCEAMKKLNQGWFPWSFRFKIEVVGGKRRCHGCSFRYCSLRTEPFRG